MNNSLNFCEEDSVDTEKDTQKKQSHPESKNIYLHFVCSIYIYKSGRSSLREIKFPAGELQSCFAADANSQEISSCVQ